MIVNGKKLELKPGINVCELLQNLNLNMDKVVVEVNLEIIPKQKYKEITLKDEDKIEIISFVGGG